MVNAHDQFLYATDHTIYAKRHYLTQTLREKTGSIVQFGILKGYRYGPSHWAEGAGGACLLGTYEPQVCALIDRLKSPEKVLIDIGAADGLYGVGLVAVGAFGQSVCFEAHDGRRQKLQELADELGLGDRIAVHGVATAAAIRAVVEDHAIDLRNAVIISDIEGGEFDLFDTDLLESLSDSHLIIETHDFLVKPVERAATAMQDLKDRAGRFFNVHDVKDGLRYMRDIPLLADWSDADTWMMCMEGRKRMMTWLYLAPKREPMIAADQLDALIYDYQKRMFG